jgi:hypothetical protein
MSSPTQTPPSDPVKLYVVIDPIGAIFSQDNHAEKINMDLFTKSHRPSRRLVEIEAKRQKFYQQILDKIGDRDYVIGRTSKVEDFPVDIPFLVHNGGENGILELKELCSMSRVWDSNSSVRRNAYGKPVFPPTKRIHPAGPEYRVEFDPIVDRDSQPLDKVFLPRSFEVVNLLRALPVKDELQHNLLHDSGQDQLSRDGDLLAMEPTPDTTPAPRRKRESRDTTRPTDGIDYDFPLPAGARPKK